jgi:hypothetical protein
MTGIKDNGTLGEVGAHILSELISGTTLREYIRGCSLNPLVGLIHQYHCQYLT